ncbi:MAG: putative lipid II flippase FtsW [Acidobacteria bacterium]|nr:putative lipid II flippase FtsW [Acidobacteriota bacterium]MCA1640640.1 putative lipid II flippase FtsW [Acidobacteriota bacterium]
MAKKLQADEWLFAATAALALFGVVMVYSASADISFQQFGSQYYYVKRQAVWTIAGLALMLVAAQADYRVLSRRFIVIGLLITTVIMLVAVFGFPPVNGARRWIRLPGGFTFQPSEFSKIVLAIYLARLLERRAGEEASFKRTFVPCLVVTGVLAGLVAKEPDLGTAMMLGVVCLVMLYTAGARLAHLGMLGGLGLAGVVGMLVTSPWRMGRIWAYLHPWDDAQGKGFQVVQSLIAVGSGGTDGLGFAEGRQKMFFLPFAYSDYIFAVVGEELGLVGALTVLAVFALFLWRGIRAVRRAPDRFGMLLGMGIVSGIVAQALFNMSVVLSLVPSKGIPLPFISYGGSSMLLTLGAVGVLLNISQQGTEQSVLLQERAFAQAADAVRAKSEVRRRPPVTQTWRPEGR